ncbi:bacteriophage protein [Salmonella bongori]|nr:bacteriophage protein [Salmonella bongori]
MIDFDHFTQQYRTELAQHLQEGKRLADIARQQPLTLLYAAKNTCQNHALVLAEWLREL